VHGGALEEEVAEDGERGGCGCEVLEKRLADAFFSRKRVFKIAW